MQDLADAVERVSELLERKLTVQNANEALLSEIKHWSGYLRVRRKVLLDETISELKSGKWEFTTFAERRKMDY